MPPYSRSRVARGGRRSSSSSGARRRTSSTEWVTVWSDPNIVMAADTDSAQVVITEAEVEAMTEPTMVAGFVTVGARLASPVVSSSGILFIGMGVIPGSVISIAETPMPDAYSNWNWFWHRILPLSDSGTPGTYDQTNSLTIHDQIRSARRLDEGDKIIVAYAWNATEGTPSVSLQFGCRLLLRSP